MIPVSLFENPWPVLLGWNESPDSNITPCPNLALKLPIILVRPVKWKKHFNLLNSEKDASRTRAIEIFPYFSSQLSKKKDANKADAILIASFYYETYKIEE